MAVSLSKGQSVSLVKKNTNFSDISINLKWNEGSSKGIFGWFGKKSAVDLDLGCLYEMKDGEKNAVQALGNAFGSLNRAPYIQLSGDDRSGANEDGETLIIKGEHWDKIKRVLVYAFIYEGVANWSEADGVVRLKTDNEDLEVKLDQSQNGLSMCAIAMLENVNGQIKVTKVNDYYHGHSEMDRAHHWGLRWVAGSKD